MSGWTLCGLHTKECHLAFTSKEMLLLATAGTNLKGMISEIALSQEGEPPCTGGVQSSAAQRHKVDGKCDVCLVTNNQ